MRRIWLIGILCIGILIALLFLIIQDRRDLAHYQAEIQPTTTTLVTDDLVRSSLQASNLAVPSFGGKVFISYEKLGEENIDTKTNIYVWYFGQEYYEKNGVVGKGTAVSVPVALHFESGKLIALNIPRDGSNYGTDIVAIFPDSVKQLPVFSDPAARNELVDRLKTQATADAQKEFTGISEPVVEHATTTASSTPLEP